MASTTTERMPVLYLSHGAPGGGSRPPGGLRPPPPPPPARGGGGAPSRITTHSRQGAEYLRQLGGVQDVQALGGAGERDVEIVEPAR